MFLSSNEIFDTTVDLIERIENIELVLSDQQQI